MAQLDFFDFFELTDPRQGDTTPTAAGDELVELARVEGSLATTRGEAFVGVGKSSSSSSSSNSSQEVDPPLSVLRPASTSMSLEDLALPLGSAGNSSISSISSSSLSSSSHSGAMVMTPMSF